MVNLKKISTESRNQNTLNIDELSTKEILTLINNEDKTVPLAVEKVLPCITKVVDEAAKTLKAGNRVIYAGAGTSGRIGIIDAVECRPTFSVNDNTIVALMAGGESAFISAVEGAEDSLELAEEDMKKINFTSGDLLIGLTASGRTPYVVGAINYAKKLNARTASVTTSKDSHITELVDFPIECYTGCEAITGSTRMKSGTAQKLILNMISSATMIKLGKVYGNLMIDVQPTNKKLVARQIGIIKEITDKEEDVIVKALDTYQTCKKAVFHLLTGETKKEVIEKCLNETGDNLKLAMKNYLGSGQN